MYIFDDNVFMSCKEMLRLYILNTFDYFIVEVT